MRRAFPASAAQQAEDAALLSASGLPEVHSPPLVHSPAPAPDASAEYSSRSSAPTRAGVPPPEEVPHDSGSERRAMSPASDGVSEPAAPESGVIVSADSVGIAKTIHGAVLSGMTSEVKRIAENWSAACGEDITRAVFLAIQATLELAGIAGMITLEDIEEPEPFLEGIVPWVEQHDLDLSSWPLLPSGKLGVRRIVTQWQKFWSVGLACQSSSEVIERVLPELLTAWLLRMSKHQVRSLRHSSTVAALAIAEAFGSHYIKLGKLRTFYEKQRQAVGDRTPQQGKRLESQLKLVQEEADKLHEARMTILGELAVPRKYDVCDAIRFHFVTELDKLLRQDPVLLREAKWMSRLFLMIQDPNAEVRLKTIAIIQNLFSGLSKKPRTLQDNLKEWAQKVLKFLIDRCHDVDSRVAAAAIRCLGLMELNIATTETELMKLQEFVSVVDMVVGAMSPEVRSEAALFVNQHVFPPPGICDVETPSRRRNRAPIADVEEGEEPPASDRRASDDGDQERQSDATSGQDSAEALERHHKSIEFLVSYLEDYVGENLRLTERVVNAFWGKTRCLTSWPTMANACIVGEPGTNPQQRDGMPPVTPKQRLIVLYIMEAAVRRVLQGVRRKEEAASTMIYNACNEIIPNLPRLFEICRPDDEQLVLVSHVAKMLIEHASSNKDDQNPLSTMNIPFMIRELRNVILQERWQVETLTNCVDTFLHLSSFSEEAKSAFVKMSGEFKASCEQLTESVMNKEALEVDLKVTLGKLITIANRAFDVTGGRIETFFQFLELLKRRADWMQGAESWNSEPPLGVPDAELAMQLTEVAHVTLTWYCTTVYDLTRAETDDKVTIYEDEGRGDQIRGLQSCLPKAAADLRNTLVMLLRNGHEHSGIRFTAFSCYLTFSQSVYGFSERFSLEEGEQALQPGTRAKVTIKDEHVQALSEYLETLLRDCGSPEGEARLPFNAEGVRVKAQGVQPPPSIHSLSFPRFLLNCWMQAFRHAGSLEERSAEDAQSLRAILGLSAAAEKQLYAVSLCSMIAHSDVPAVRAGPLAHIVLMQCHRHRPEALRDVAFAFKKLLRERARATEHHAVHYFHMQKSVIFRAFAQSGADVAVSLSADFVRHWGLNARGPPRTEGAAFQVLRESVRECITAERTHLPLLDAFSHWFRSDEFIVESRRLELIEEIRVRCMEVGVDHNKDVHIIQFVQRMQLRVSASVAGGGDQAHTPSARVNLSTTTTAAAVSVSVRRDPGSERSSREHQLDSRMDVSSETRVAAAVSSSEFAVAGRTSSRRDGDTPLNSSTPTASPPAQHSTSRKRLFSGQSTPVDASVMTPMAATPASTLQDTTQESRASTPASRDRPSSKRRRDASTDASVPADVSAAPATLTPEAAAESSHMLASGSSRRLTSKTRPEDA
mmetsp:Transcript_58561/g.102073  ORF Transcript_58561/g.102073 Transcript_58561/m.102073 type:complete len:1403 (-) Transcript_58561:68-4276(-)